MIKLTSDEKKIISLRNNFIATFHILLRVIIHIVLYAGIIYCLRNSAYLNVVFLAYINSMLWHFFGYAGIAHELNHGTVFTNKQTNKILFYICSYLTWNNPYYFSISHRIHHKDTFMQHDVEVYRVLPSRVILCARFIIFDYVVFAKQIAYAVTNLFGFQIYFRCNLFGIKAIGKNRGIVAFHASMILLLNVGLSWCLYQVTGYWLLAFIFLIAPFTGKFLNSMLAISQHIGLEENRDKGWLHNSRTINLPVALGFMYANMNYHAEHHLFPYVPYYRLPKLNNLLKQKGVDRLPEVGFNFLLSKYFNMHLTKLSSS